MDQPNSQELSNTAVDDSVGLLPRATNQLAVFLDVDGTLIDIAETPESVIVPSDLVGNLARAREATGGALALVSGRTIETLDRLFAPAKFTVVGLHGGELRGPGGELVMLPPPPILQTYRPILQRLVRRFAGAQMEDKGRAIAIHYRGIAAAEDEIRGRVEAMAKAADGALVAQKGKMVIELKPAGAGKGSAVVQLMERVPFRGRTPIAVGDDITDEEMFAVVNQLGGKTFRVGPPDRPTAAQFRIDSPEAVRTWLTSTG